MHLHRNTMVTLAVLCSAAIAAFVTPARAQSALTSSLFRSHKPVIATYRLAQQECDLDRFHDCIIGCGALNSANAMRACVRECRAQPGCANEGR
jgi:hypothetical protein